MDPRVPVLRFKISSTSFDVGQKLGEREKGNGKLAKRQTVPAAGESHVLLSGLSPQRGAPGEAAPTLHATRRSWPLCT
jgi:hypothetical protein